MYCFYCYTPQHIHGPNKLNMHKDNHDRDEQVTRVSCSRCGARYIVCITAASGPTVDGARLEQLKNVVK